MQAARLNAARPAVPLAMRRERFIVVSLEVVSPRGREGWWGGGRHAAVRWCGASGCPRGRV
ncbi:hypothetical protein [Ornithinimicrobium kibberense]|uniref:hypothetical protein n=1 Tax=Ornithinimicrobium kibberense TaxID=282060 RepID=UPI00362150CD